MQRLMVPHRFTGRNHAKLNSVEVNILIAGRMKPSAIIIGIVGLAVALSIGAMRDKTAVVEDFTWSVKGKTAPYSFRISNQSKKELHVVITLDAENVSEGHGGTKLLPVGLAKIEIALAAHETKKIEGILELVRAGSSATTVSYVASLKEAIQPSETTRGK